MVKTISCDCSTEKFKKFSLELNKEKIISGIVEQIKGLTIEKEQTNGKLWCAKCAEHIIFIHENDHLLSIKINKSKSTEI